MAVMAAAPGPQRNQRIAVETAGRGSEPLALQTLQLLIKLRAFRLGTRDATAQHQAQNFGLAQQHQLNRPLPGQRFTLMGVAGRRGEIEIAGVDMLKQIEGFLAEARQHLALRIGDHFAQQPGFARLRLAEQRQGDRTRDLMRQRIALRAGAAQLTGNGFRLQRQARRRGAMIVNPVKAGV